jgi:L-asparaginase II
MMNEYVPVAEVLRGHAVESIHHGAAAVVDKNGTVIAELGSPDFVTYSRSSLKPFQALPTVLRGVPDRFGLKDRHLALMCASHSGEARHVQAAREILEAIDAREEDLQCGVHVPLHYLYESADTPAKSSFSPLHNNCSGKHLGMLALARILGCPFAEYLDLESTVQRLIRERVAGMLNLKPAEMQVAIDGCSAPNYAVPLRSLALGFARLAAAAGPRPATDEECHDACARIVSAMRTYPEMVSGEGRFDLDLARATNGRIFSKAGGEAVECAGIPERSWGVAVKVVDGSSRAIGPLMVWILRELGLLNEAELQELDKYINPVLKNHRDLHIGTIRMTGKLIRHAV